MTQGEKVEVAAAVIVNRGRVWIQKRRGTGHLDGFWEFPGGKLRQGESALQAVVREVREETGIHLPAPCAKPLQSLDYSYADRIVRLHFFLCRLQGAEVPAGSAQGQWVKSTNLADYSFPPANRPILELLKTL